jgi:hypothetical protein
MKTIKGNQKNSTVRKLEQMIGKKILLKKGNLKKNVSYERESYLKN